MKCIVCQTEFVAEDETKVFCSRECWTNSKPEKKPPEKKPPEESIPAIPIRNEEYPIINKISNRLYYVAKDGYIYSVPMKRGGGAYNVKEYNR